MVIFASQFFLTNLNFFIQKMFVLICKKRESKLSKKPRQRCFPYDSWKPYIIAPFQNTETMGVMNGLLMFFTFTVVCAGNVIINLHNGWFVARVLGRGCSLAFVLFI